MGSDPVRVYPCPFASTCMLACMRSGVVSLERTGFRSHGLRDAGRSPVASVHAGRSRRWARAPVHRIRPVSVHVRWAGCSSVTHGSTEPGRQFWWKFWARRPIHWANARTHAQHDHCVERARAKAQRSHLGSPSAGRWRFKRATRSPCWRSRHADRCCAASSASGTLAALCYSSS